MKSISRETRASSSRVVLEVEKVLGDVAPTSENTSFVQSRLPPGSPALHLAYCAAFVRDNK